jgi:hypothetical protein
MNKNIFKILFVIVFVAAILTMLNSLNKKNKKRFEMLTQKINQLESSLKQDNQRILELTVGKNKLSQIVDLLKVYTTYDENGPLKLIRLGREGDGGYVVPAISFEKAEALFGYGISNDISFEEEFSTKYNKNSYGFDCSIDNIEIKNKLTHFIPDCLATDKFLYNKSSSTNISTFSEQLKKLNLEGKKVFIKMDIEGAEYDAFPDMLNNAENISGIVMELHLNEDLNWFNKAIDLLTELNKNFYLVNNHGNNCGLDEFTASNVKGAIPQLLQLTYINKNLVDHAEIAKDQSHPNKLDTPNCSFKNEHKFVISLGYEGL